MTDTKAIKDIGREICLSSSILYDHTELKTEWCEPGYLYTPEQRRELVRRVWQACDESNATDYRGDLINDISSEDAFKQFIEREKL